MNLMEYKEFKIKKKYLNERHHQYNCLIMLNSFLIHYGQAGRVDVLWGIITYILYLFCSFLMFDFLFIFPD